jgi:hypothetical protein
MRTKRAIENQLQHFRNGCPKAGTAENEVWIQALEWVLAGPDDPAVDGQSPFARLVTAAIAARHALRSYEYGNDAPDLARGIADQLERAIPEALEERQQGLAEFLAATKSSIELLEEIQSKLPKAGGTV